MENKINDRYWTVEEIRPHIKKYKSYRIVDGKPRWVIVDENGKIINRNPNNELKGLEKEIQISYSRGNKKIYKHNDSNTCNRCNINFAIAKGNPRMDNDNGKWLCKKCYDRDYQKNNPNSTNNTIKSLANCRTKNQDPNSSNAKGDKIQKLINILENFECLNERLDNFTTPIDSIDPKTGLKYQIKGKWIKNRRWCYECLEKEWNKEFHSIFLCCVSEDGNIVERIYKIPKNEITELRKRNSITIYKNQLRRSKTLYWYEKYRITNKEYIKEANEIWKQLIDEND